MENQEPKETPETTTQSDASDRSPGKDRGAEVKSDASSSHQNNEVENQKPKKTPESTPQSGASDRSPGQDRDL
jgi:hypothetical protein